MCIYKTYLCIFIQIGAQLQPATVARRCPVPACTVSFYLPPFVVGIVFCFDLFIGNVPFFFLGAPPPLWDHRVGCEKAAVGGCGGSGTIS